MYFHTLDACCYLRFRGGVDDCSVYTHVHNLSLPVGQGCSYTAGYTPVVSQQTLKSIAKLLNQKRPDLYCD